MASCENVSLNNLAHQFTPHLVYSVGQFHTDDSWVSSPHSSQLPHPSLILCNHHVKGKALSPRVDLQCLFVSPLQTYKDSDIDVFTFGTAINTISLATILLHQAMEMKTWVSAPLA